MLTRMMVAMILRNRYDLDINTAWKDMEAHWADLDSLSYEERRDFIINNFKDEEAFQNYLTRLENQGGAE